MLRKILLVTILVLGSSAGPLKRNKRSLGLLKLGYDWATQGLSAGLSEGLITGFSDLSTGGKIGAGLLMAKPVALTLLGKYALYDWLTKGSSAGFQADLGIGPFKASGNAGFGASFAAPEQETVLGDFWYEPITGDNLPEKPQLEQEDVTAEDQTPVEVEAAENEASLLQYNGGLTLGPLKLNTGLAAGR